ncbi:hypothetical protein GCM10023201_41430 [Actinomycetospora corticicola]
MRFLEEDDEQTGPLWVSRPGRARHRRQLTDREQAIRAAIGLALLLLVVLLFVAAMGAVT